MGPRGITGQWGVAAGSYGCHVNLDADSGEPLYQQLADLLRTQIGSGELSGRVPSAKTLAQQYDVSHRTSERALSILREEGLIRSVMGKGHYTVPRG